MELFFGDYRVWVRPIVAAIHTEAPGSHDHVLVWGGLVGLGLSRSGQIKSLTLFRENRTRVRPRQRRSTAWGLYNLFTHANQFRESEGMIVVINIKLTRTKLSNISGQLCCVVCALGFWNDFQPTQSLCNLGGPCIDSFDIRLNKVLRAIPFDVGEAGLVLNRQHPT